MLVKNLTDFNFIHPIKSKIFLTHLLTKTLLFYSYFNNISYYIKIDKIYFIL